MALKVLRNFKHPYYTALIAVALLLGLGLLLKSVLGSTVFEQHASQDQFTAFAVKGSFYVDTNRNGNRDSGEKNYTGQPQPHVRVALFSTVCGGPTPTNEPSMSPIPPTGSPTPTPPTGCYYRKLCPQGILCRVGICPPCKEQLVCPSTSGTPIPPQGNSIKAGAQNGGPVEVKGAQIAENPSTDQNSTDEEKSVQQDDLCKRLPVRVINCPVATDGTYTCTAENVQFSEALVFGQEPARYTITSTNPVSVKAATATVDFGVATFFRDFQSK